MKVLQIHIESRTIDWGYHTVRIPYADMLYEAAQAVFRSLPDASIVRNFSAEMMDAYNEGHDLDNRDAWHLSCGYWQKSVRDGYQLRFETATSEGRSVEVTVLQGAIEACSVTFLEGSENAAGAIIDRCQDALSSWIAHFVVQQDISPRQASVLSQVDVLVTTLEEGGVMYRRRMGELVPMTSDGYFYTIELGEKLAYLMQQAEGE